MVKAKKGLILSLFTLLVAVVVTTTSTYAWFVMNSSVSVTNMQITAKADSTYLVIESAPSGTGDYAGKIGDISSASLEIVAGNATVLPTQVKKESTNVVLTNGKPTWQTAKGTSYNDGTASTTPVDVDANKVGDYVAKFSFVVGLNPIVSKLDAANLKIKDLTLTSVTGDANKVFYSALSVVVVAKNGANYVADYYESAGAAAITANNNGKVAGHNTVFAETVSHDGTPIEFDVYVYIDGNNANVTTQNAVAANLGKYGVAITFAVDEQ